MAKKKHALSLGGDNNDNNNDDDDDGDNNGLQCRGVLPQDKCTALDELNATSSLQYLSRNNSSGLIGSNETATAMATTTAAATATAAAAAKR